MTTALYPEVQIGLIIGNIRGLQIVGTPYAKLAVPTRESSVEEDDLVIIQGVSHETLPHEKRRGVIFLRVTKATRKDLSGEIRFTQNAPWRWDDPAELISRSFPTELQKVFDRCQREMRVLLAKFWTYTTVSVEDLIQAFSIPIPLRKSSLADADLKQGYKRLPVRAPYTYYAVLKGEMWEVETGSEHNGVYTPDARQYASTPEVDAMIQTMNRHAATTLAEKQIQEEKLQQHPIWHLWGDCQITDEQAERFVSETEPGYTEDTLFATTAYDFFSGLMDLTYQ